MFHFHPGGAPGGGTGRGVWLAAGRRSDDAVGRRERFGPGGGKVMRIRLWLPLAALLLAGVAAAAADRFVAFNLTTTTDLTGLYLAPAGTRHWGPNQVLNDPDKVWEHSERLKLSGIVRGRYDAKVTDGRGRVCIKPGIDLTQDLTFDIRDADLARCR